MPTTLAKIHAQKQTQPTLPAELARQPKPLEPPGGKKQQKRVTLEPCGCAARCSQTLMRLRMHPCAWKRSLLPVIVRHVCNRASANCKFMFYGLLHQSNITFSQQRCERAASSAVVLSSSSPPSDSVRLPCGSPPRSVLSCGSVKSTQTGIGSVSARLVLERRDRSFAFCKLRTHSKKFLVVPAQPHPLVMELRLHVRDFMFDQTLCKCQCGNDA